MCNEYHIFSMEKGIMDKKDFYENAHLIVAAVSVLSYQGGMPPAVESIASALSLSLEECHFLCRKLEKSGIIEIIEGAFGTKVFIKNHLELESIPRGREDSALKDDLEKFISSKKSTAKEIETIKAEHEKKKKDLFAEIDEKLRKLKNKS
jgi:DNA-binding Lrp family transcriptional regulator